MTSQVRATNLRFEHHPTGLGVPHSKPRLSWNVSPASGEFPHNWTQQSYEVEIKRMPSDEPRKFQINKPDTVLVPWPDEPLKSSEAATVRVRSFGASSTGDSHSDWSDWAGVEAALLDRSDWTASFISSTERSDTPHSEENGTRPRRFRKTFTAPESINHSRLYISALGIYEAYLNGKRIGDECLAPGWTAYQHRIQFQVCDVKNLLVAGENVLTVEVGEGWYAGRLLWEDGISNLYGHDLGALTQLDIYDSQAATAPSLRVQTDGTWEWTLSPTVAGGIYDGETYDMRLEESWMPVRELEWPKASLVASACSPIRVTASIKPISILKDPDGKAILDFGQNLVGRVRIPSLSRPDGHRLTLRFAEVLEHDRLGTRPLRRAKATDAIIFGGDGVLRDWYPKYTFHGFRYVEVNGWTPQDSDPLTLDSIIAEVMHTDMERTGYFSCSDEKLNQLHKNVVWSMRGNFLGIPTDCPQRDERLGWTGDIQVFCPTASYLYSSGGMLSNWMQDVVLETREGNGIVPVVVPNAMKHGPWPPVPQAVWDDVIILVPWTLYLNFGDVEVLRDAWQEMKSYLKAVKRGDDGLWDPTLWQLGDWLDPNAPPSDPGLSRTDGVLVADEYLVYVTSVMGKIATVLGLDDESTSFQQDHQRLRQVFQDKYIARSGLMVGDSQTCLALAIAFDLYTDPEMRKVAAARLARLVRFAKFQVSTGFAGTPVILEALTKGGYEQIAYRMMLEEGCPSWLYPVTMGATTIWERWDSMLEDGSINPGQMTSFNHYALGSVVDWLHRIVGGISLLEPGWKKFLVKPIPGGTITNAEAIFHSPNGEITCSWQLSGDNTLTGKVKVPMNATALIDKPDGPIEVGSGEHHFQWTVEHAETWSPKPLLTEFRDYNG